MSQDQQTREIKRTICVGLGGTGRDVLMRIRRFIIDQHGSLANLPVVSFVQIDTDKNTLNSSGLPTGKDYHGEEILFRDIEKVMITMSAQDVNNFRYELEHPSLGESPYSHIESWFDPRLKDQVRSIEDGAQGIRPVGRLAFFHNYRRFKQAIEAAVIRTMGHEGTMLQYGYNVQPGLDVFIVGSLCGGTGSGTFLDVAYAIRNLYINNTSLYGYLVISPTLYGNAPTMRANVYAALKELNYYTTNGKTFEACYDKQHQVKVVEARPPFDFPYLISEKTFGDYQITEKGKLCNVIAYKIYLTIASELGGQIRSYRDNFLKPEVMFGLDSHPFRMPQHYLTFGLASIYFNRERMVTIALNRLALRLVQFWLNGAGQSPDSRELTERFLLQWSTGKKTEDFIISKLEENTRENNKNFNQTLNAWKSGCETKISEAKNSQDVENLKQNLPREFKNIFRTVQAGDTESTRGVWLTNLQKAQPSLSERLKQDIDEFLQDLSNPDKPEFSINSCLGFLESLMTEISKSQRSVEERKQDAGEMHPPEKIDKIWVDVKQEIGDLESKNKFPLGLFKGNQTAQIQTLMLEGVNKAVKNVRHNFNCSLQDSALKLLDILQDHIALRLNQIQSFEVFAQNVAASYEKREEELKQANFNEMSGEAITTKQDIDQYLESVNSRSQLCLCTHQVTSSLGEKSIFSLIDRNRLSGNIDELKDTINSTMAPLFKLSISTEFKSVMKAFMGSYSIADTSRRLRQILDSSQPLLSLNLGDQRFYRELSVKRNDIISLKETDESEVKQFKRILLNEIGVADSCFKPTQKEDEILIISQYGGFPLRIINDLRDMKEQYLMQRKSNSTLHNDYKTQFIEILPTEAKLIEGLELIFYPCLAFDLIKYDVPTQRYEFDYYDDLHQRKYPLYLNGSWREALEELVLSKIMVEELRQRLAKAETDILSNPGNFQTFYMPLVTKFVREVEGYTEQDSNFLYKTKVIGEKETMDSAPKEGIIPRYINDLRRRIQEVHEKKLALTDSAQSSQENYQQARLGGKVSSVTDKTNEVNGHNSSGVVDVTATSTVSPKSTTSPLERIQALRELKKLWDEGAIDQEEYENLKREINS